MPLVESFHLKQCKNSMKHIGSVRSHVNRTPIRYEMTTVSCKRGLKVLDGLEWTNSFNAGKAELQRIFYFLRTWEMGKNFLRGESIAHNNSVSDMLELPTIPSNLLGFGVAIKTALFKPHELRTSGLELYLFCKVP